MIFLWWSASIGEAHDGLLAGGLAGRQGGRCGRNGCELDWVRACGGAWHGIPPVLLVAFLPCLSPAPLTDWVAVWTCSKVVRKSIARVLTVINQKKKFAVSEAFADKVRHRGVCARAALQDGDWPQSTPTWRGRGPAHAVPVCTRPGARAGVGRKRACRLCLRQRVPRPCGACVYVATAKRGWCSN